VIFLFLGRARNNLLFLILQPKHNIMLWHLLQKRFFGYVGYLLIWEFLSHPTPMYCDNQSSIQIAYNSIFHERTKHIEIDCYFTRHHLKHDTITLPFVSSSLQIADFFTESHFISRFHFLVGKLSILVAAASWVWGEILKNIYIYLVLFIKGRMIFSV